MKNDRRHSSAYFLFYCFLFSLFFLLFFFPSVFILFIEGKCLYLLSYYHDFQLFEDLWKSFTDVGCNKYFVEYSYDYWMNKIEIGFVDRREQMRPGKSKTPSADPCSNWEKSHKNSLTLTPKIVEIWDSLWRCIELYSESQELFWTWLIKAAIWSIWTS